MDDARRWTDERLREMEQRITDIYTEAEMELRMKWYAYMQRAEKRVENLQKAYDEAKKSGDREEIKKTGKALGQAQRAITLQNKWYQDMVDEITTQLAHVNQTAVAYMNEQVPSIYATNYNAIAPDAERFGISFTLTNEYVVRNLINDGDITLPRKKINIPKDKRWNTRALNDSVLQGILQGESMDRIADRIVPVVGNNRASAIRNARTMVTGAENRGRYDSYRDMEDNGVVMKKQWMATPDDRTRPSHMDIDGEEQDVNHEFSNGLMYPGDPAGAPEEVWNCRCTMTTNIYGFRRADGSISHVNYTARGETMHTRQMREERNRRAEERRRAENG